MKVAANRVRAFAARPDPRAAGFLIFGPDPMEVDALRQRLVESLTSREEMDVTRMEAQEARRDPAALTDSLRSAALFGGKPLVLLENAGDGLAQALDAATDGLTPEMGALVVTAGQLGARGKLRKLFEGGETLAALGVYPQPLDRGGVESLLREAEVGPVSEDGMARLVAFAGEADAAELRAAIRTLALLSLDAEGPLSGEEVAAILPDSAEGEIDAVVAATAARRADLALAAFARLAAQGTAASGVAMALGRQFRQIHALAAAPDGAEAAIGRLRPPVFGPRRDALLRAARAWPLRLCETALEMILDAEFTLRSTEGAPDRAVVERLIVRISTLRPR